MSVLDKTMVVRFPNLRISVDGPFRAPAILALDQVYNHKTGVIMCLVASGIGVTPFIAILDGVIELIVQGGNSTNSKSFVHPNTQIHLYWMTRRVDDFLLALPAFKKIQAHPVLQNHIFLHLHVTALPPNSLDSTSVFLFRWGIKLNNELLRSKIVASDHPVPLPWLYKQPQDLLGLRYLAVEESNTSAANAGDISPTNSETAFVSNRDGSPNNTESGSVIHSVVFGRPDLRLKLPCWGQ